MNIRKLGYLLGTVIFGAIGVLSLFKLGSMEGLIASLTIAVLCLLFYFIFNVKWNETAKANLDTACESLKSFGVALPLKIIGKLSLLWVILLIVCLFKPFILTFITIPEILFTIIENISIAFFLIGIFYELLSGSIKQLSLSCSLFALYQLVNVILSFLQSQSVMVSNMGLFLTFWTLFNIFSIYSKNKAPKEKEVKDEPKKEKKHKKNKKSKEEIQKSKENQEVVDNYLKSKEN